MQGKENVACILGFGPSFLLLVSSPVVVQVTILNDTSWIVSETSGGGFVG